MDVIILEISKTCKNLCLHHELHALSDWLIHQQSLWDFVLVLVETIFPDCAFRKCLWRSTWNKIFLILLNEILTGYAFSVVSTHLERIFGNFAANGRKQGINECIEVRYLGNLKLQIRNIIRNTAQKCKLLRNFILPRWQNFRNEGYKVFASRNNIFK